MKKLIFGFCILFSVFLHAQQTKYVDFIHGGGRLTVDLDSSKISGLVTYDFNVLNAIDSIYIDAKKMNIEDVFLDNEPISFDYNNSKISIKKSFKSNQTHNILILYSAKPKKAMYFLKREDEYQVWTQGQGKYTSHWLPSFDDVNEKLIFSLSVNTNDGYEVITNGQKTHSKISLKPEYLAYNMQKPMSSYLVALAIGKYDKKLKLQKAEFL